ncbi:3-deoxy-7-phosphoheptulonate synthase class II [Streptomyces sodiiphilus]|uniref:Phospho-2-dehydro-3-deoxyheptonate aldolase n=1 Tax=Streptomyces sodiiphilus TaxID=226217 RepID=A0ABP5A3L7_9ACTN
MTIATALVPTAPTDPDATAVLTEPTPGSLPASASGQAPASVPPAAPHQPVWPDPAELRDVRARLSALPSLVPATECELLRDRLAAVANGEAVVVQGGDCAEAFDQPVGERVRSKADVLDRMSETVSAAGFPVVRIGRLAGQYAKPRSSPVEIRDGVELPAYRGDAVNGSLFDPRSRTPDPRRMLRAYRESAGTLAGLRERAAAGEPGARRPAPTRPATGLFVSHEALLLDYETTLVRTDSVTGARYAGSGHLLWIGERTRQPDGAHVEFAARVRNPVGVKLGPGAEPDEVLALIDRLDPEREPGRLVLIVRMGAGKVRRRLPRLVEKVRASGAPVVWLCDPMHGNTVSTSGGVKTRRMADVLDELTGFFEVHREMGTHPGGVHAELTGDPVTECVGGGGRLTDEDLRHRYESLCDPRLNGTQSLELAARLAELYR